MRIDLSCAEHTPEGNFLGSLIYSHLIPGDGLFKCDECRASPHNGGVHTLILNTAPANVEAFLDLVEEQFSDKQGCSEFVRKSRKKLI